MQKAQDRIRVRIVLAHHRGTPTRVPPFSKIYKLWVCKSYPKVITIERRETVSLFQVIGAMKAELKFLNDKEPDIESIVSGVGKVNAAIAAADACLSGDESVVVIGTAGGIDPKLKIGDIVISDSAQQHDVDVSPLGFKRGDIPFESTSTWKADRDLVTAAQKAAKELSLRHSVGRVLSGDRFITDPKEARWLRKNLHGVCVDMETAAIAQVCHRHNIPWVSIRMISDATNKKSPKDFLRTIALASERCGSIVAAICQCR